MTIRCALLGHQFIIKHWDRGCLDARWTLIKYKFCQRCGAANPDWSN